MRKPHVIYFLLTAVICLNFSYLKSQNLLPDIQQITTHPAYEFAPSVSPDGKWIAFTSEREDKQDIWIMPLPWGSAIQITSHQAEDAFPVWSPKGDKIAFVSKRDNAVGNIWVVPVNVRRRRPAGNPTRVTSGFSADLQPVFSADGQGIFFTSTRGRGQNIWYTDLNRRETKQITFSGGSQPRISPDGDWILFTSGRDKAEGELYLLSSNTTEEFTDAIRITENNAIDLYGGWSPDGLSIILTRIDSDTDKDGQITPFDNASLWQKQIFTVQNDMPELNIEYPEIKITTELFSEEQPFWAVDDYIYFESSRGIGLNIWRMPAGGLFPKQDSAIEQFLLVTEKAGTETETEALYQSILGYQRVIDYFPSDRQWSGKAMIQTGDIYRVLGDAKQAEKQYMRVQREYEDQNQTAAEAVLKLAVLDLRPVSERINYCLDIISMPNIHPSIEAQAWLVLGDLYTEMDKPGQSLQAYTYVIENFPNQSGLSARAQLGVADLLSRIGQYETAAQNYLALLRRFGNVPLWRQMAVDRLMRQAGETPEEKIRGYQAILQQAGEISELAAEARLSIIQELIKLKRWRSAKNELENFENIKDIPDWASASADILHARVHMGLGDETKAHIMLENVMERYSIVDGGRTAQAAADTLFKYFFESAQRLRVLREYRLAEVRYIRAIELKPDHLDAHRGLVESTFYGGRAPVLLNRYQKLLEERPDDPAILYGLGLLYSYLGEHDSANLNTSNYYLTEALESDYRLVYPYRTLSYNYELMERLETARAQEGLPLLKRLGHIISAPFRWAFAILPFKKSQAQPTVYYEEAIRALITALAINDAQKNPEIEASLAQNLANNFYNLGEYGYGKALEYYTLRFTLNASFSDSLEKAILFERAGHCAMTVMESEKAKKYLDTAIKQFERLGENQRALQNKGRLALLYQLTDRYEDAIPVYEQMVSAFRLQNQWRERALAYRNLAYNYYQMSEMQDAFSLALKAAEILEARPVPIKPSVRSKLRIGIFGIYIPVWSMDEIGSASAEGFTLADELAFVYGIISRSAEQLRNYSLAELYEKRRLDIFTSQKDRLASRISRNRLGVLYLRQFRYNEAWETFYNSWQSSMRYNDEYGTEANILQLARTAIGLYEHQKDSTYLNSAIDLLETIIQKEYDDETAQWTDFAGIYAALGILYHYCGIIYYTSYNESGDISLLIHAVSRYKLAVNALDNALIHTNNEKEPEKAGLIYYNLSKVIEALGDNKGALEGYEESLRYYKKSGFDTHAWRVFYGKARLLSQIMPPDSSEIIITAYSEAINALEEQPLLDDMRTLSWPDMKARLQVYEDYAGLLSNYGEKEHALLILEKRNQRQAADWVSMNPPEWKRERHKILWGNLRYVRDVMRQTQARIQQGQAEGLKPSVLRDLNTRLNQLKYENEQIKQSIREEDASLAYFSGVAALDPAHTQNILSYDYGVLAYLTGKDSSWMWMIDSKEIKMISLPLSESDIAVWIKQIEHSQSGNNGVSWQKQLFDALLLPALSWIDNKHHLIIVPDKDLWHVPFSALVHDELYLSDRVSISFSPSLEAYRLAWNNRKVNKQKALTAGTLYDDINSAAAALLADNSEIIGFETPSAQQELIAAFAEYDLLHMGSTLKPDRINPFKSLIGFENTNMQVYSSSFFSKDISASLAFLPPAEKSDNNFWHGSIGFFYSMLYAGVPTVIQPLWQLDYDHQKIWMNTFYQNLNKGSAAEAVAEAELNLLENNVKGQYAGYRVYGFEGLGEADRMIFARDNLLLTVQKGRAFENQGDFKTAIQTYEQALSMASTLQDSLLMQRVINEVIRASDKENDWARASRYQQQLQALNLAQGNVNEWEQGRKNLVELYKREGRFDQAAQMKREMIRQSRMDNRITDSIRNMEELADIYAIGREWQNAVSLLDTVIHYYANTARYGEWGQALLKRGRFFMENDRAFSAMQDIIAALQILKLGIRRETQSVERRYLVAAGYQLLGLAAEQLTLYPEALEYQEEGLGLFIQLDQITATGQGHQYLANIYWKMGRYKEALEHQIQAMDIFDKSKNNKLLVMGQNTKGLILMGLGREDEAEALFNQALILAEENHFIEDQSTIIKNIGLLHFQKKAFQKALTFFKQSVHLDSTHGFTRGLAYGFQNKGKTLAHLEDYKSALTVLEHGVRLSRMIEDQRNLVNCFLGLSMGHEGLNNLERSIAYCDSGLVLSKQLDIPELTWRLFHLRARQNRKLNAHDKAVNDYSESINIIETMRSDMQAEAMQQGFLENKMDVYSELISYLFELNRIEESFNVAERAKSRSFLDMLSARPLRLTEKDSAAYYQVISAQDRIRTIKDQIRELNQALKSAVSYSAEKELEELSVRLISQEAHAAQLLKDLQHQNPELASLLSVDPWPSERIRSIIPDSTALVEYYVSESELFIWILTASSIQTKKIAVNDTIVNYTVKLFRESIESGLTVQAEARQLYEWLIRPVLNDLSDIKHIILVPHAILHYCPFAALENRTGQPLISRFTLSFSPSATVYGFSHIKSRAQSSEQEMRVAVFANPDLKGLEEALPFAEKSVQSLERTFSNVSTWEGSDVTISSVKNNAPYADIIHFATHAVFEAEDPLRSALLLTSDDMSDGRLEASEIFGMTLNSNLVTLSACETGLGRITKGDEIIGLSRSFIYAGASSIITSLWKVPDLETAVLMKRFYRFLNSGYSKAEALQKAQLMVMNSVNSHPSAWAAFTLTGNFE